MITITEEDLPKYGFELNIYPVDRYTCKTVYSRGTLVCEFDLNSITHKENGKEISREEFFEKAIKKPEQ